MAKRYDDLPLKEVKNLLKKLPPNVKIRVYYDNEEGQVVDIVKPNRHKTTLSQRLDKLTSLVTNGFSELKQEINGINTRLDNVEKRLDHVDTRLDYIVQANNLKDIK